MFDTLLERGQKARKEPRMTYGGCRVVIVLYLMSVTMRGLGREMTRLRLEVPNGWIVTWGDRNTDEPPQA